ncbi:2314_t:CDS:2 [Paraglomus brasilianum]|uniref:RNA-binding protein 48 n=1 Tax=Paraglomus brasilianum TaxID=144538 RepID=A0A9N8ZHH3_9GLOM|nr:2314_t:CDS:2 [Paraglomus brasilianum]
MLKLEISVGRSAKKLIHIIIAPAENRPKYRAGRKLTAVKVYTVNQESRYLVIENVPALRLTDKLLELVSLYGTVEEYRHLDDYPSEEFTDVYWIKFRDLKEARAAKKQLDDKVFYQSPLRVRYGPEYESVEDTRQKLQDRRNTVASKLRGQNYESSSRDRQKTVVENRNSTVSEDRSIGQMQQNIQANAQDKPPIPGIGYPSVSTPAPPTTTPRPTTIASTSASQSIASGISTAYKEETDTNSSLSIDPISSTVLSIRQRLKYASSAKSSLSSRNENKSTKVLGKAYYDNEFEDNNVPKRRKRI